MKLLYLVPSLKNPGGMERILIDKINYLVEVYGYSVSIITTDQMDSPVFFSVNENVNVIHLNIDFNKYFRTNIISKYFSISKRLKIYQQLLTAYIKENKIDICISLGGKELEFFSKIKVPCKKVCELHFSQEIRSQFLTSRSSNVVWKLLGNYRTKQLIKQTQRLDKLVVLTVADQERWQKTNDNVVQIYNFSSLKVQGSAELKRKRVIAVGRLDAQKGFDLLIDAWRIVNAKHADWVLDIYGQGEWLEMLSDMIKTYNIEEVVNFKGINHNIEREIIESSVFALSSRYEGFPMVLLESLACGVPIVAFNCKTGPSEIITGDDCGVLVPRENVTALANGIISLIENEGLRIMMGNAAQRKFKDFRKDRIMEQWDNLFRSLSDENFNR